MEQRKRTCWQYPYVFRQDSFRPPKSLQDGRLLVPPYKLARDAGSGTSSIPIVTILTINDLTPPFREPIVSQRYQLGMWRSYFKGMPPPAVPLIHIVGIHPDCIIMVSFFGEKYGPIGIDLGSRSVKLLQFDAARTSIWEASRWDMPNEPNLNPEQIDERIIEALHQAREGRRFRRAEGGSLAGCGRVIRSKYLRRSRPGRRFRPHRAL